MKGSFLYTKAWEERYEWNELFIWESTCIYADTKFAMSI